MKPDTVVVGQTCNPPLHMLNKTLSGVLLFLNKWRAAKSVAMAESQHVWQGLEDHGRKRREAMWVAPLSLSLSPPLYLFLSVSLPLSLSLLSCVPCDCRPIRARGPITKRAMTPIRSLLFGSYLSQCLELSMELISFISTGGVVIKSIHLWDYYGAKVLYTVPIQHCVLGYLDNRLWLANRKKHV